VKLACDVVVPGLGYDYVAEGATANRVHAAMMAHGGQKHANLMDGVPPEEQQRKAAEMDAHIRQLIDANTGS
jgi:hypothetical protein